MKLPADYTDPSADAKRREFRSAGWWVAGTMILMLLALVIGVAIRAERFEERVRQLERVSRVGQALVSYFSSEGEWPEDVRTLAGVGAISADDVLGPQGRAGPPLYQFVPLPLTDSQPAAARDWVIAYGQIDGKYWLTSFDGRAYELSRSDWARRIRSTYEAIGRAGEIPAAVR